MTQLGPFDISLIFQKNTEVAPGHLAVMDQMTVTFSPQQFKALVRAMNETLTAYETSFGALTIANADTAPLRTAEQLTAQISAARKAAATANEAIPSSTEPQPPSKRSRAASRKKEIQP